jgi:hypothetical protein
MEYDSSNQKMTKLDRAAAQESALKSKVGGKPPERAETLSLRLSLSRKLDFVEFEVTLGAWERRRRLKLGISSTLGLFF